MNTETVSIWDNFEKMDEMDEKKLEAVAKRDANGNDNKQKSRNTSRIPTIVISFSRNVGSLSGCPVAALLETEQFRHFIIFHSSASLLHLPTW